MSEDNFNLLNDIYYSTNYADLYADEENSLFNFEYKEGDKLFKNLAIKKPIKMIGDLEISDGYFDLETPYGYGGYYVNCDCVDFISRAFTEYKQRCVDENIIAEFIRFHPFNYFPEKYSNLLDFFTFERNVVIVDLTISKEERWKQYSQDRRNKLRKADSYLIRKSTDLTTFIDLYIETMKKNNADEFYFFDKNYIENLFNLPNVELIEVLYDDDIVSMGFFMYGEDIGHYHLSANDPQKYNLYGNYYSLERAFDLAKERGCKYFMLGGGRTNDPKDGLLKFKMQFSKIMKNFNIAGMVFIPDRYRRYTQIWEEQSTQSELKYFLKYRLKLH